MYYFCICFMKKAMAENAEKGLRLTLCFPKIDANRKISV